MWAFLIIVIFLLILFMALYNNLIRKKNNIDNIFGSIDALLKKRFDLIPNLVETVKQYMKFEEKVQVEVTDLRSRGSSTKLTDDDKVDIDNKLSTFMGGLKVSVENYPDLKANQNFQSLMAQWNEIENQLADERRTFNAVVTQYNNAVEMFPSNIAAYIMGLQRRKVFEIPEPERQNVNAKELFG